MIGRVDLGRINATGDNSSGVEVECSGIRTAFSDTSKAVLVIRGRDKIYVRRSLPNQCGERAGSRGCDNLSDHRNQALRRDVWCADEKSAPRRQYWSTEIK